MEVLQLLQGTCDDPPHQDERSAIRDLVDVAMEHGSDAMAAAFATLMNHAMQIEREQVLNAEMYVQGVSTRKVTVIVEELCGLEVTSTQVSRAAAELDEHLDAWRNRPIGEITYLILVARYQKTASQLADWPEQAAPEAETVLQIPAAHRRRLRMTNGLERLKKEIKRRTRVATLFPNEASLLRLASAVLSEISDDNRTCLPEYGSQNPPLKSAMYRRDGALSAIPQGQGVIRAC